MGKRRRGESCGACYITAPGTSSSALVWGRPSERAGCCSLTGGSSSFARRGGPCQRAFHRAGCCSLTGGRQGTLSLLATLEQVQAHRFAQGLLATVDIQFVVETAELGLDRVG